MARVRAATRGTATTLDALTTPNGLSWVLAVDTTNKRLRLYDGTTAGGIVIGAAGFTLGSTVVAPGSTVTTVTALTLSGATLSGITTLPGTAATISSAGSITLDTLQSIGWGTDAFMMRDASNRIGQRNGANAQLHRIYATYTDGSNNANAFIDAGRATAGVFRFGTQSVGTGAGVFTGFRLDVDNTNKLDYGVTTAGIWTSAVRFRGSVLSTSGYTVAGLPAGTVGDIAYVTDALAPTFLATVVGGGAITTPVFYNGSNWVGG